MKKSWWYYGAGLVVGLTVLVVSQLPDENARIIVCDVGQGDGILITKGQNQVLVDGGPSSEKILSCLERHVPFWDRQIELIVLTNTDFDHMNGLSAVVERYHVIRFVTADGVHESQALMRLASVMSESSVAVQAVEQGDTIKVGVRDKLSFQVLWPPEVHEDYLAVFSEQINDSNREQILGASAKRGNLNERSVVLLLLEDNYTALLMGDAGDQAEKELLEQGLLSDVDYLKVGHHGSKYASTASFLEKVKPELAVISVGANNRYSHPTQETLGRLEAAGAKVARTDQQGTVVTAGNILELK